MRRRPWENRSVVVALVLAVLVPGLGHLFQLRIFKGLIYLVGILGLFVWGVYLGEGVVVYNLPEKTTPLRRVTLHYAAQLGAGAIAYPVYWQQKRAQSENNRDLRQLTEPMTAPFSGKLRSASDEGEGGELEGTIRLAPETGEYGTETKGSFSGTLNGQPIELALGGGFELERPIASGFKRKLKCGVVDDRNAPGKVIIGTIPRPIVDGYGIAPSVEQLQELTGRLGKLHELALVFTWVAGLLNILAIWDCVQGPAYGFGDESFLVGDGNQDI